MPETDPTIAKLETRISFLEKHVEEQDAEIYGLSKRIDTLVKVAKGQKEQLAALAEMNSSDSGSIPADEKPPHY